MPDETKELHNWLKGCIEGDAQMQRAFYYHYYGIIMRIAIRYASSKEDAEQWVHDSFLKIFNTLDKYRFQGSFEGWLKKIAVRTCLDNIRAGNTLKNEVEMNTDYNDHKQTEQQHFIDNAIVQKMGMEEILKLMERLPAKARTVFNLHVFEEYSHKEIAELMQITENHSYWLLHQARKTLKTHIVNTNTEGRVLYER